MARKVREGLVESWFEFVKVTLSFNWFGLKSELRFKFLSQIVKMGLRAWFYA